MKLILTTLTAICFTFFLYQSAQAHPERSEHIVERITDKLSLTESQQSLLKIYIDEKKQLRAEAKEKRHSKLDAKDNLAFLSDDTYLTVDQLNSKIDAKHAERKAARQASILAFVNFRNSLSVEQREEGARALKRLFKMKKRGGPKGMHEGEGMKMFKKHH